MAYILTNKRRPGYNKSVVDTLGSVDDYGAKAEFPILDPAPKLEESSTEIKLFFESKNQAVLGRFSKEKKGN